MKLLYWSPCYAPDIGGVETLAAKVLPVFVNRGHAVKVVAQFGEQITEPFSVIDGVEVHRYPFRSMFEKREFPQIIRVQRELKNMMSDFAADVMHLNLSGQGPLIFGMTTLPRAPMVVGLRQELAHPAFNLGTGPIFKKVTAKADWITCVCTKARDELVTQFPQYENKCSVQHNAIDAHQHVPLAEPDQAFSLLCIARLVPQKGIDRAIDAMRIVKKTFPQARLKLAGDGPLRHELEGMVRSSSLSSSIEFLGALPQNQIARHIQECNVVIVPSRHEGFPNAVLEACAGSRPVVAFRCGGIDEIIVHEKTGFIVEQNHIIEFAEKIISLLASRQLARGMGLAARSHVEKKFSLNCYIDQYENLYQRLMGDSNCPQLA